MYVASLLVVWLLYLPLGIFSILPVSVSPCQQGCVETSLSCTNRYISAIALLSIVLISSFCAFEVNLFFDQSEKNPLTEQLHLSDDIILSAPVSRQLTRISSYPTTTISSYNRDIFNSVHSVHSHHQISSSTSAPPSEPTQSDDLTLNYLIHPSHFSRHSTKLPRISWTQNPEPQNLNRNPTCSRCV